MKRLALVIFGAVLGIALAEIGLRILAPQPTEYFYFEKRARPNSTTMRWGIPIRINSVGYRDVDHSLEKPAEVKRIAAIGDSITYGSGVHFHEIYHQRLLQLLEQTGENFEVLAFNQGATSTNWAVTTYAEVARKYKPDLVLLGFCLNDFDIYEDKIAQPVLSLRRLLYDLMAEVHQRARIWSHLYFLIFERSRRFIYQHILDRSVRTQDSWIPMAPLSDKNKAWFTRALASTTHQIKLLNDKVRLDGGELLVVIFPFEMQLTPHLNQIYSKEYKIEGLETAIDAEAQQLLMSALTRAGVSFVDVLPVYRKYLESNPDAQLYFRELGGMLDWAHPNALGHLLAAEAIFHVITD